MLRRSSRRKHWADVVDDRDVHPDASRARCRSGEPTSGDSVPTWEWGHVLARSPTTWVLRPTGGVPLQFFGLRRRRSRRRSRRHGQLAMAGARELPADRDRPADRRPSDAVVLVHLDDQGAGERVRGHRVASRCPHVESKPGARNYRVQISTRRTSRRSSTHRRRTTPSFAPHDASCIRGRRRSYWHCRGRRRLPQRRGLQPDAELHAGAGADDVDSGDDPGDDEGKLVDHPQVRKLTARVRARGVVMPQPPGKAGASNSSARRAASGVVCRRSQHAPQYERICDVVQPSTPGSCKIVSRFPGDTDHRASSKTVAFRC